MTHVLLTAASLTLSGLMLHVPARPRRRAMNDQLPGGTTQNVTPSTGQLKQILLGGKILVMSAGD